jgi:hypothetical protein
MPCRARLHDGDKADAKEIAVHRCAAPDIPTKDGQSQLGTFHLIKDGIEITPGPESYHSPEEAHIISIQKAGRSKRSPAKAMSFPPTNWNRSW